MDDDPTHPRVLIADEDQHRITEIADVISGSGHTVVARLFDVSEVVDSDAAAITRTWQSSRSTAMRATRSI